MEGWLPARAADRSERVRAGNLPEFGRWLVLMLNASTAPHIPSAMPLPNYVSSLYGAPAFHAACLYIAVNGTSAPAADAAYC